MSFTRVFASTTVGTPIAITGTPSVSLLISWRDACTPEPGTMPVEEICIVLPSRARLLEASASIAMTKSGFILRVSPTSISVISIPVCPSTPGETALTLRRFSNPMDFASSSPMCRVASTPLTHFGPSASGVMTLFPIPQTSALPLGKSFASSPDSAFASVASTKSPVSKFSVSIVTYLPFGLPVALSPDLSSTCMVVIFMPSFCCSW